ncbi:unnamed protein product [Amoebophrya sp. A25]|nr:unnamed protein product [Amoebophrya sp. A25]|eukprot:GSA25T00014930001.1
MKERLPARPPPNFRLIRRPGWHLTHLRTDSVDKGSLLYGKMREEAVKFAEEWLKELWPDVREKADNLRKEKEAQEERALEFDRQKKTLRGSSRKNNNHNAGYPKKMSNNCEDEEHNRGRTQKQDENNHCSRHLQGDERYENEVTLSDVCDFLLDEVLVYVGVEGRSFQEAKGIAVRRPDGTFEDPPAIQIKEQSLNANAEHDREDEQPEVQVLQLSQVNPQSPHFLRVRDLLRKRDMVDGYEHCFDVDGNLLHAGFEVRDCNAEAPLINYAEQKGQVLVQLGLQGRQKGALDYTAENHQNGNMNVNVAPTRPDADVLNCVYCKLCTKWADYSHCDSNSHKDRVAELDYWLKLASLPLAQQLEPDKERPWLIYVPTHQPDLGLVAWWPHCLCCVDAKNPFGKQLTFNPDERTKRVQYQHPIVGEDAADHLCKPVPKDHMKKLNNTSDQDYETRREMIHRTLRKFYSLA